MEPIKSIQTGYILMVICCIFYLAWWSITFNPMKTFPAPPKYILFCCIAISGIAGLVFLITPMGELPSVNAGIPASVIITAGIALYVILLYLTSHFLHRQVTTELFLIVGWAVLELCVLSGLFGAAIISVPDAVILSVVIIAAAAISMICYLLYYDLEPVMGFYDGMVPLLLFGVIMAVQAIMIK